MIQVNMRILIVNLQHSNALGGCTVCAHVLLCFGMLFCMLFVMRVCFLQPSVHIRHTIWILEIERDEREGEPIEGRRPDRQECEEVFLLLSSLQSLKLAISKTP
ncbi:hypothetical protein HanIR_Chr16g0832061 [Helianthus annuus]|nr:hypothetical protein HanIR_Chr16g0832061 [Helianthus annuus]KAJ0642139.1 hypothetical protein HanLR1_Chr16g0635031 [Helianthus annuus]